MNEVRSRALTLRLRGHSYNEISRELGIPKSTLSGWFKDLVLSQKARERLSGRSKIGSAVLVRRNKLQTAQAWKRARRIQKDAQKEIGSISCRELLLIGVVLYWAEGYKKLTIRNRKERTSHVISLANSDPILVALFVRFLREIMNVASRDIRVAMRLYEHINEADARRHWRSVTKLGDENFDKTLYLVSISSQRKRPYNRLPYGTVQVYVSSTEKFHRLMGWIEGIKKFAII